MGQICKAGSDDDNVKRKLTSRFSARQIDELDRKAGQEGISRAEALRRALDLYLGQPEMEAVVLKEGKTGTEPSVTLTTEDGKLRAAINTATKAVNMVPSGIWVKLWELLEKIGGA